MIVGRVLPSARTTASAIESTAKGATGPEGAVETTIGAGDKRGMSSERSPADKLLLVERGGFGMMYDRTPTSDERVRGDHEKEVKKRTNKHDKEREKTAGDEGRNPLATRTDRRAHYGPGTKERRVKERQTNKHDSRRRKNPGR